MSETSTYPVNEAVTLPETVAPVRSKKRWVIGTAVATAVFFVGVGIGNSSAAPKIEKLEQDLAVAEQAASDAEKETATVETQRDNVVTQRDAARAERDTAVAERDAAKAELAAAQAVPAPQPAPAPKASNPAPTTAPKAPVAAAPSGATRCADLPSRKGGYPASQYPSISDRNNNGTVCE